MTNRISSLDAFRVIGALLIFICHITIFYTGVEGGLPVELFLVLSGFVIGLGLNKPLPGFKQFMIRRVMRLYPVYFIGILCGLLYMTFILDLDIVRTILKLPLYLLCLQTISPLVQPTGFDSPAWYVATLVWIYVGYYAIRKAYYCIKYKKLLFSGLTVLFILIFAIEPVAEQNNLTTWLYYFSPYSRIVDFLLGVVAAWAFKKYPLKTASYIFFNVSEVLSLIILGLFIPYIIKVRFTFEMGLPIAGMFYVFSHNKGVISRFFSRRFFSLLGEYTYAFYLIHYLVIMSICKTLKPIYGYSFYNITMVFIMFIISCVLAYCMQKFAQRVLAK